MVPKPTQAVLGIPYSFAISLILFCPKGGQVYTFPIVFCYIINFKAVVQPRSIPDLNYCVFRGSRISDMVIFIFCLFVRSVYYFFYEIQLIYLFKISRISVFLLILFYIFEEAYS